MTAAALRDLGDVLLRISCTFVGGLLVALTLGVEPRRVHAWGWVLAVVCVPLSYAVRRHGEVELALVSPRQRD